MKRSLLMLLGLAGLIAGLLFGAAPSPAADHLEAPLVQLDGRTDINDVYAFQSPTHPDKSVLIMTVNPAAGVISGTTFDPNASYLLQIDNTGDAVEDLDIVVTFGPDAGGKQAVQVSGAAGSGIGETGSEITLDQPGSRVIAGLYDDPFFFDFQAFLDGVKGAGGSRTFCDGSEVDFFRGFNASAIVVELPSWTVNGADSNIAVWAETKGAGGTIDRMGRPAIATVLVADGSEDQFNATAPADQPAAFASQVNATIAALSDQANADALTPILLPDVLTFDTANAAGFLNGRQLADDVIDAELTLLTAGGLTGDCVDSNDKPFPNEFPYLAQAQGMEFCRGEIVTVNIGNGEMPSSGDDVILGTADADTIDALAGNDLVCGGGGDDLIAGGSGKDRIFGGAGNDQLDGGPGSDYLRGGQGNDTIKGGQGVDTLVGAGGMDELRGEGGSDRHFGGEGNDTIYGGSGADRIWGAGGNDVIYGMGGKDTVWAGPGDDIVQGNHNSDVLFGGPGNDVLQGARGKDTLLGDAGNDQLFGGGNADTLTGGLGDDLLNGQAGRDTCDGGLGANTIVNC